MNELVVQLDVSHWYLMHDGPIGSDQVEATPGRRLMSSKKRSSHVWSAATLTAAAETAKVAPMYVGTVLLSTNKNIKLKKKKRRQVRSRA